MSDVEPTLCVNVDPTNPGQFFACCGLLEVADRLWDGAEAWFARGQFHLATRGPFPELIRTVAAAELVQLDPDDDASSAIGIMLAHRPLRLDWWLDERAGGKDLKVWAGTMKSVRIARGMQHALGDARFHGADLFDVGQVTYDPLDPEKKVEPFYFDARRGPNAHSRDVGFSPNDLQMTTTAFPAVEFFCLLGLQRALPARTGQPRVFEYYTWAVPLPPGLIPAAVCGLIPHPGALGYRFENWYRTGQKKHKAFRSAVPIARRDGEDS
jgi:hypothetical protein